MLAALTVLRGHLKFSLGSLLLLTAIAAMAAAWWREKQRHAETADKLAAEIARSDMLEEYIPVSVVERAAGRVVRPARVRNEGRFEEALDMYHRLYKAQVQFYGEGDHKTMQCLFFVGELYNLTNQPAKAEPFLEKFLAMTEGSTGTRRSTALSHLGGIYRKKGRHKRAEVLLRESIAIKKRRPQTWTLYAATSGLGACLLGQLRLEEAEPLLIEGYEGLIARESEIWDILRRKQLTNAAQRLVTLYEKWGKPDKAVRWRQELDRIKEKYPEVAKSSAR